MILEGSGIWDRPCEVVACFPSQIHISLQMGNNPGSAQHMAFNTGSRVPWVLPPPPTNRTASLSPASLIPMFCWKFKLRNPKSKRGKGQLRYSLKLQSPSSIHSCRDSCRKRWEWTLTCEPSFIRNHQTLTPVSCCYFFYLGSHQAQSLGLEALSHPH